MTAMKKQILSVNFKKHHPQPHCMSVMLILCKEHKMNRSSYYAYLIIYLTVRSFPLVSVLLRESLTIVQKFLSLNHWNFQDQSPL